MAKKTKNKKIPQYKINFQALIFAILAWLIVIGCICVLFFEPPKSVKDGSDICLSISIFIGIASIQTKKVKVRSYKNSKPQLHIEITPKEILNDPKKVAILTPNKSTAPNTFRWGLANLNQEIVFSTESFNFFIPLKDYFKLDSSRRFEADLLFETATEMVNKKSRYIEEYYYLAQMYELGIHVSENKKKALELYQEALTHKNFRYYSYLSYKTFLNDMQININERIKKLTEETL